MFCSKCGNQNGEGVNFCRTCGNDLGNSSLISIQQNFPHRKTINQSFAKTSSKDPDELTGNGIGSVIVGDGFFLVAVILSTTSSSVGSLLWLFLLIPAFFFFGKGFADVLHAKQIMRRLKQKDLNDAPETAELPPNSVSFIDSFKKQASGELAALPSVTEGTTHNLR